MVKQSASSVLDVLNSGDELSSDNNESDECNRANDIKITEERIEHGGTDSEQGNELTSSSLSSVPSLAGVLRAPRLSDPVRKRRTQTNYLGKHKKTRSSSSAGSDPKGVKPKVKPLTLCIRLLQHHLAGLCNNNI